MNYLKGRVKGMHRGQGGFTLIELLIVIAILGIVAAVVALNIGGFFGQGKEQAANTEAHQVQTAVIAYMAENNASSYTAGDVGPATSSGPEAYLLNPPLLQADYTINTDGSLATGTLIMDSKWTGCTFASGTWDCP
jgi:prepilin-type N-terminal cleavage/methylation domain-containing protein